MAVFFVNGTEVSVEKNQRLLRYLRDTLHLTSVKDGCSEGACGACTVLIDGEPIRACTPFTDSRRPPHHHRRGPDRRRTEALYLRLRRGRSRAVRLLHPGHGALHQGAAR